MKLFIVIFDSYDDTVYEDMVKYVKMNGYARLARNVYIVSSDRSSAVSIRDEIDRFIGSERKYRCMVMDYDKGLGWASHCIPDEVTDWLKKLR